MDDSTVTPESNSKPVKKRRRFEAKTSEERATRLRNVQVLRFVKCWPIQDIATETRISYRQIQRDIDLIRKRMRKSAEKNLEAESRDIAEDFKLRYEEKIKHLFRELNRLEENSDSEKTRLARFSILKRITDIESAYLDHLRKLGIITSPDDTKPGVNIGFMIGKPDGKSDSKETEDLERELAESVTILGGNKSSSINRL
jgi:hypothetical protein